MVNLNVVKSIEKAPETSRTVVLNTTPKI